MSIMRLWTRLYGICDSGMHPDFFYRMHVLVNASIASHVGDFREMGWDVDLSWQLRGLRGNNGMYLW